MSKRLYQIKFFIISAFILTHLSSCKKACEINEDTKSTNQILLMIEKGRLGIEASDDSILSGYIDTTGKLILKFHWDQALDFEGNFARARWGNKWGLINQKGEWVLKPSFDDIGDLHEGKRKFLLNNQWGFIDSIGKIIQPAQYTEAGFYSDNLAPIRFGRHSSFVDEFGNIKWNISLQDARPFNNGIAWIKINNQWKTLNTLGQIGKGSWTTIQDFSEDLAAVSKDSLWGYIDTKENIVLKIQYQDVRSFQQSRAAVKQGEKWGFMDRNGRWSIEPKYDELGDFYENCAWFRKGNFIGLLDISGKEILSAQYDGIDNRKNGFVKTWKYLNDSTLEWKILNRNLKTIAKGVLYQANETLVDTLEQIPADTSSLKYEPHKSYSPLQTIRPWIKSPKIIKTQEDEIIQESSDDENMQEIANEESNQINQPTNGFY